MPLHRCGSADWPFWINLINSGTCHSLVTRQAKMSQKIGTFAPGAQKFHMNPWNVQPPLHHFARLGLLFFHWTLFSALTGSTKCSGSISHSNNWRKVSLYSTHASEWIRQEELGNVPERLSTCYIFDILDFLSMIKKITNKHWMWTCILLEHCTVLCVCNCEAYYHLSSI